MPSVYRRFRLKLVRCRSLLAGVVMCAGLALGKDPWLDIPFVEQSGVGCGAAAVSMLMQYWAQHKGADAYDADYARVFQSLPRNKRGVAGEAMRDYLQSKRFTVFVIDADLQDVEQHLDKGRPVIVCLAPRGPKAPLHYAVVVGYSEDSLYLNDPARGRLFRQSRTDFLRDWKQTGNWMLLAVPSLA